jgi:anti-sigma regulatory factor (Ser/Thr protein kinase)
MWIKSDERYIEYNQLLVDSGYVKNMLQSIIDALQTMGWSLSNIVKLRIAAIEDITL